MLLEYMAGMVAIMWLCVLHGGRCGLHAGKDLAVILLRSLSGVKTLAYPNTPPQVGSWRFVMPNL